jgi:hypothetical protein
MSGIGHLAPGFAAKIAASRIPLWVFLLAGETNDILYFVFTCAGIETRAVMTMDFAHGVRYLTPASIPWSHGLFMSVVWSVMAAAIAFVVWRESRASLLLGTVVFSHWLLDFLMHSNLPLLLHGSPLVGLGLENSGPGFLFISIFDLVILSAGIAIYFRMRKRASRMARES